MTSAAQAFRDAASQRILIKDGPYGTAIQAARMDEAGYRGDYELSRDQKGNNDLVNLTNRDLIAEICTSYIDAGADVLATNTFNANRISQADYGAEHLVAEMNRTAAKIIRECVDTAAEKDGKRRYVAGALGPTNKTLSLSPDVNDPGFREIDFDFLKDVYREQSEALIEGGADFLLVETVFDTLNAKCAAMAAREAAEASGRDVPLMMSMTITDRAGRNLSGHSISAFWNVVRHVKPITVGLNCSFGADLLRPHIAELEKQADTLIMAYPNAGLPNDLGEYDELPEETAALIDQWADDGLVNVVGGCCGTSPEHIAAIARHLEGRTPRAVPDVPIKTGLAGIDPFTIAA